MINKRELADKINVSLATIYNWERTKPELINMIENHYKYIQGQSEDNELLKYFYKLDKHRQELYFTKIKLEVLEKEAERNNK